MSLSFCVDFVGAQKLFDFCVRWKKRWKKVAVHAHSASGQ